MTYTDTAKALAAKIGPTGMTLQDATAALLALGLPGPLHTAECLRIANLQKIIRWRQGRIYAAGAK